MMNMKVSGIVSLSGIYLNLNISWTVMRNYTVNNVCASPFRQQTNNRWPHGVSVRDSKGIVRGNMETDDDSP